MWDPASVTDSTAALLGGAVAVVVVAAAVLPAVRLAARITRPWLLQAVAVGNLGTE